MLNTDTTVIIGGYEVTFSDGRGSGQKGIRFKPDDIDIKNKKFLLVMDVAKQYFPDYERVMLFLISSQQHWENLDREWLAEEIKFAEKHPVWLNENDKIKIITLKEKMFSKKTEIPKEKAYRKGRKGRKGYVYLLKSPSKAYKIGLSSNPEQRLKNFGIQLPFEVQFEHLISTNNMYRLEKELHTKFASKRINGEWFNLSDDDVAYIKGLAS